MRTRSLSALVALTSCVGVLAAAEIPRTADGHPDLSGTYDVATRTPLQRPKELGERATLSDAEAVAMAKKEAALVAQAQAGSDPDRDAPAVGGAPPTNDVDLPELTFAAGEVGGYNLFWIERGAGAFKIDGAWRTSVIIDPTNGRYPPLTPEAVKGAQARAKLRQKNTGKAWWLDAEFDQGPYDNPEQRPLAERCLLGFGSAGGPPLLPVLYNNLKRIVQTEDNVMIFAEMVHDARIVRTNAEHEPPYIRRWMGDSIGRWEGDTLVVDTTNFNDTPALSGASRNLHVVERFTRIDADTLIYRFTVEDPSVWTAPWTGEYVWPTTDKRVYEYACHEANYSFLGIMRGARQLEAEAQGKTDDD